MTSKEVFQLFVDNCGSRKVAAELLCCSYVLVCHIANGVRPVSKEIAEKVEALSEGRFKKEHVLWGDADAAVVVDERRIA
jgi:succinate dehydrogenase/fumarate reductase cytochrome b subunit